jgi:hypothetical protein
VEDALSNRVWTAIPDPENQRASNTLPERVFINNESLSTFLKSDQAG